MSSHLKSSALLILSLAIWVPAVASTSRIHSIQQNAALVKKFYDLAFNQHQAKEAALAYLSEEYIQHNPHVATGRKAFIEAFSIATGADTSKTLFIRTISEGNLVVLHSHKIENPGDRGTAGIDIFRVKNGKITEHWDVNQCIPETAKNTNTMF
ncbi:MAG: nuclear transport factor 2 family protein [Methylotenera sp.]|nr:nuclear transport factor 2 family protein [Oligoflexia bacterium]